MVINKIFRLLVPTFYMGGGGSSSSNGGIDANFVNAQIKGNQQMLADQDSKTWQSILTAQQAQSDANVAQARGQYDLAKQAANTESGLNRFNQYGPNGSVTWQNLGTQDNPQWVQNTTLDSNSAYFKNRLDDLAYAKGLDAHRSTGRDVNLYTNQAVYHMNNLPKVSNGNLQTRQHVEQGLMDRLNPYLQRDEEALRTRLANQGLAYGGEAYSNAMQDQGKRVNDARLAVIAQGGDEMQRSQNMNIAQQNQLFSNIGAAQNIDFAGRNQDMNDYMTALNGRNLITAPQYTGATTLQNAANLTPNLQNIDMAGMIYGSNQAGIDRQILAATGSQQMADQIAQRSAQQSQNAQSGKNSATSSGIGALGTIGGAYLGGR